MEDLSLRESGFEPRAEQAIMSMWERMKSLESKYIDLANFYKQELLQAKNEVNLDISNGSKSAVGGVIQPGATHSSEDAIINELKSEKIRFEHNIKAVIASGEFGGRNEILITNEQLIRLNNEIQGAFQDILEHVDQSQQGSMQSISTRQNEMFQLTTKYRISSSFKNDAVGIWYDAKTGVTQNLQKLRQFIEEKGMAVMAQTFQPKSTPSENVQKKEDYTSLIRRFEQDMVMLKQGSKDYNQSLQMIKQAVSEIDKNIQRDKDALTRDYKSLMESLDDVLMGGNKVDLISQASRGQASSSVVTSPFDKKQALQTGGQQRSGSRGQKPPKLTYQQSAILPKASPLRSPYAKKNTYFDINDVHPELRVMRNKLVQYDASLDQYLTNQALKEDKVNEIVRKMEYQVQSNVMKFLATHDIDIVKQYFTNTVLTPTETAQILAQANLEAHAAQQKLTQSINSSNMKRSSVSPYRGTRPGVDPPGFRKTTPTRSKSKLQTIRTPSKDFGSSSRFQVTGESIRLQELQSNTDSLFNELRKANDKCIEVQIENRKLKDKIQVLSLQMEDLRIHNNRYQMQAQVQVPIKSQRKTKTTRSGLSPYRMGDGPSAGTSIASGGEGEEIELCKRIDLFFTAMKFLQRAVNKKEDISELKVEFESKQRALQKLSKQIQARNTEKQQNSQYLGSEPSSMANENLQMMKNRSSSSRGFGNSSSSRPASSSFRGTTSPLRPSTAKLVSPKPSLKPDQNSEIINKQKQTIKTLEQQIYSQQQEQQKVISQVKNFENLQTQRYQNLQKRLEQREIELDNVKTLFVERLRELESNFAEIGDHLIANQEKKKPEPPKPVQKFIIEENDREQDEKTIEELTQTNSHLHDQINDLRQKYKDFVSPADHKLLKDELNEFDKQIRALKIEKQHLVKMFDTLSKERDTSTEECQKAKNERSQLQFEVRKLNDTLQDVKYEKEQQEMIIDESIKKLQQQLKDEIEQKICFQKEVKDNESMVKLLEEENEGFQSQMAALEMEKAQLKQEVEISDETIEKLKEQVKDYKEDIEAYKDEKAELLAENTARQEQLEETEEQLQTLKEILKTKDEELESSQQLIEKLEDELREGKLDKADVEEIERLKKQIQDLNEESKKMQDEELERLEEVERAREEAEKAVIEAESKLNQAKIEAEQAKQLAEAKVSEAMTQAEQAKQEAEIKLNQAKSEAEKQVEQAKLEAQSKLDQAEYEAQSKLQEVEQDKLKSIEELEKAKAASILLQEESQAAERRNWWMTALQLRVKRCLQQKLEKQAQEVYLLKEQLESKELGDSEQVKQLTQKEAELRQKLEEEMALRSQEIDMLTTEKMLEAEKNLKEIENLKKAKIDEIEEVKKQKSQEIEKLAEAKNNDIENLKKQKEDEVQSILKQKEQEVESVRQKTSIELESLKKLKEDEVESLKKQKEDELESLKKQKEDEVESIKQQSTMELEQLKKQKEELESLTQNQLSSLSKKQEEELQQKQQELNTQAQKLESLESEKTKLLDSLKQSFQATISQKEEEIESLVALNDKLMKDLEDKNNKSNGSDDLVSELEVRIDEQENEITKLNDLNDDLDLKISEQAQEIEELKAEIKDLQEKMNVDNDLVAMLLNEKKESKETAVEMENIIEGLEKEREQLKLEIQSSINEAKEYEQGIELVNIKLEEMVQVYNQEKEMRIKEGDKLRKEVKDAEDLVQKLQKDIGQLKVEVNKAQQEKSDNQAELKSAAEKLQTELKSTVEKLDKAEAELANYKEKLEETHKDLSSKVDSGHDNVKKMVDIHKTNEELSSQLLNKSEQCKKLEADLASQKQAHEILLQKLAKAQEEAKDFETQIEELQAENKKGHQSFTRNSVGSDDDYQSVSEMKDHLKHARQILIQFIQKLPYSAPDNEATLPIIFSMFEFTKQEQEKMMQARQNFNQDRISNEVKDKTKKMFGNFMKKKGNNTNDSFNSGGTNTNQSQGK